MLVSQNPLVTGLKEPSLFALRFPSFLSSLAARYPSSASLRTVSYSSHILTTRDNDPAALVRVQFNNASQEDFCDALMQPTSETLLLTVSTQGLLGFSAVEDSDLEETWNMTVLKQVYVHGADRMDKFQLQAVKMTGVNSIPDWIKLASFVADTTIEIALFSIHPSLQSMDLAGVKATRAARAAARDKARGWFGGVETAATQLLRSLAAKNRKAFGADDLRRRTAQALDTFFASSGKACELLDGIAGPTPLTTATSRAVFVQLYKLTYHACAAFSLNEELMQMYTRQVVLHSVSVLTSGISAVSSAVEVGALMQARAALRPEGWATRLGRSVGLVTWPSPQELARKYAGEIAGASLAAAWSVGSLAVSTYGVVRAKHRRDCCEKMAYLIFQTWQAAAEGNMFLEVGLYYVFWGQLPVSGWGEGEGVGGVSQEFAWERDARGGRRRDR
ncbi:hypothetical protein GE09DRAFT_1264533 [Coniochaeta sp. 2T2.1]|nr:hypothetical protein GE09DRAFT_1264533 [Coniochaeta sp. 2T2.1]